MLYICDMKKITNVWNRTQIVTIIRDEGKYSLCENERGVRFYYPTKLLKDVK